MNIEEIEKLLTLMDEHEVGEVKLEDGDFKLKVTKIGVGAPVVVSQPQLAPIAAPLAPQVAGAPIVATETADDNDKYIEIKSPIVGTFYRAPSPDVDAFVQVGSTVSPDTTVCIIEAMKVMNEINAEVSGTVKKVCAENGEAIEYGQVLYLIEP